MKQKIKSNYPIILILLLAGFLYLYGLWNAGFANQYYAAGVYSMGERLHAFLFNSLDSVGFITIDKPPLGFWIQVIFTKAFGFSGFVLLLPQAICGVLSVYFIYRIISKRYGKTAGYVSALVLALTPIFVATSRNNTIDGILILMLVLAADQAIKAAEKSSMKHLIFAGIWIGLGFNVKMLQAFMIVPAIYLVFLLFSKQKIVKRLLSIVVSVIILLVISLSWVMIVDLVPEDDRPYVGSSDNNSAVELVLGHNGVSRILGRGGSINKALQPQNAPQGQNKPQLQGGNTPNIQRPPRPSGQNGQLLPKSGVGQQPTGPGSGQLPSNLSGQNNLPNQNNGFNLRSPGGETGEASIVRLFNQNNAGQISWLLLPAMVIALASLYWIFKKKIREEKKFITLFFFAMS
ncbi:MAG: glycosyltransferase family 39 protein [Clostridiales bacterium]|nr:glycosyltransferase family 39 protein [Clostridiales bacterium]